MRSGIARKLEKQSEACGGLGSPLYELLLAETANDVLAGGPTLPVMEPFADEPPGGALALKLMGSVHRLVLERKAPELATFYPSVGGSGAPEDAWPVFRRFLEDRRDEVIAGMRRSVQTNEVGRSAALLGGFLEVARCTGLPLRLLEVGSSAGLNLRWDHFRYQAGNGGWGPEDSPVRFDVFDPPPPLDGDVRVASRSGVDPAPLDPSSAEDRLTLSSYVWPDQVERWERLKGAFEIAAQVPAGVECGQAADWLEKQLQRDSRGEATVIFHSIVMQYVSPEERARIVSLMLQAGERATADAPLAWLRMEPPLGHLGRFFAAHDRRSDVHGWLFPDADQDQDEHRDHAVVSLALWPGGTNRIVARSGYHGSPVVWLGG